MVVDRRTDYANLDVFFFYSFHAFSYLHFYSLWCKYVCSQCLLVLFQYLPFARVARAAVMQVRDQEFIEAAKAVGAMACLLCLIIYCQNL